MTMTKKVIAPIATSPPTKSFPWVSLKPRFFTLRAGSPSSEAGGSFGSVSEGLLCSAIPLFSYYLEGGKAAIGRHIQQPRGGAIEFSHCEPA